MKVIIMGRLKTLFLSSFFIILSFSAYSQSYTGCLYAGRIYVDPSIFNPGPNRYGYTGDSYALGGRCNNGTTVSCRVYYNIFGDYYNGVGSTYSITNCPLDDYIWLLILPLSSLGFYYMCNKYYLQHHTLKAA